MWRIELKFFLALALMCLTCHVTLRAFEKSATFTKDDISPRDLDAELERIAQAIDKAEDAADVAAAVTDTILLDVDSLYKRVDTTDADVVTNAAQIDTCKDRLDALEDHRDSVFYAYDANGNQLIATITVEYIELDTEVREDGIYTHADDDDMVVVSTAGDYKISYSVSLIKTNADDAVVYLTRCSGGCSEIEGSRSWGSASATVNYSGMRVISLSVNDSIAVAVYNVSTSNTVETKSNGVSLLIEKLH